MTKNKFSKKVIIYLALFLMLFIMSLLLIKNAYDDSATTDEPIHILTGYEYWQGTFSVNPEHPPLGKQIAAIPLNFIKPVMPADANFQKAINDYYYDSWQETRAYAENWLYDTTGNNPDKIITLARLSVVAFTIILGIIIFFTARRWYGAAPAIIAVFFYAFSPLILTHGHLANTDLWMCFGFFISIFSFAWFLEKPNLFKMIVAAVCFSAAILFKFSAVVLVLVLSILWFIKYKKADNKTQYSFKKFIVIAIVFCIISLFLIWADYSFPLNSAPAFNNQSGLSYTNKPLQVLSPILEHLPLPEYFKGVTMLFTTSLSSRPAYILGNYLYNGVWYYFPLAFLVKEPLSLLILFFSAIASWILWKKKLEFRDWVLILPIIIYFALALVSKLNIGLRHLLPIYPFIFIFIGYFISELFHRVKGNRKLLTTFYLSLAVLFAWYLYANISIYPYYMTYFNELAGGAKNGWKILADSNMDWGQDMKRLAAWVKEENIQEPIKMGYFWSGYSEPKYYGINYIQLKANDPSQKGYIVVGASTLYKPEFAWLKNYKPIKIIGNSVFVYKIE